MRVRSRVLAVASLTAGIVLAGGLVLVQSAGVRAQAGPTPVINVGGPQNVPFARFFGSATLNGVAAPSGATVVASVGTVVCGTGASNGTQYQVDVQSITGCTTPGAAVTFTINGNAATSSPSAVLPQIQGTAVLANLTATTATPSPTPSPSPSPTAAPPPPPPPPPPAATPAPTQAPVVRTATPTAAVPVTAPRTGLGGAAQQKPSGPAVSQKPAAPVAQAARPGAVAQAPVARPALPNTGTGGVAGSSSSNVLMSLSLLVVAAGLSLVGARGLLAKRS